MPKENNVREVDFNKTSIMSQYADNMYEGNTPGKYIIPKLKTQDFLALDKHAIERPYHKRLRKMKKHFDKKLKTLTDVAIIVSTKDIGGDFNGTTITIKKGDEHKLDAHTRGLDWQQTLDQGKEVPEFLMCTVYEVDSWDEYTALYYSFDSSDSAEKPAEKIAGTYDILGIAVNTTPAVSGNYATALSTAYPGADTDSIIKKVSYFKEEIELLDETKVFGCKSGCQSVYAMALTQAKLNASPGKSLARLTAGLQDLSRYKKGSQTTNDLGKFYGPDLIAYVYLGQDEIENAPASWKVEPAYLKKTSYATMPTQLNFLTYCMDIYMTKDPKKERGGVKRSSFENRWEASQVSLLQTHPISGVDVSDEDFVLLDSLTENDE